MPDRLDPITILKQTHAIDNGTVKDVQKLVDQGKDLLQRGHQSSAQKFFDRASRLVANTTVSGLAHGEQASVEIKRGKTKNGYNVTNVTTTASNTSGLPKDVLYDYRKAVTMTATGDGKNQRDLQKTAASLLASSDIVTVLPVKDEGLLARVTGKTKREIALIRQRHAEQSRLQQLKNHEEFERQQIIDKIASKQHKPTPASMTDLEKARRKSEREAADWFTQIKLVDKEHVSVTTETTHGGGFFATLFGGNINTTTHYKPDPKPDGSYHFDTHDPNENMAKGFEEAMATATKLGDEGVTVTRSTTFIAKLFERK